MFTSHERALAKQAWSSTRAKLKSESFLPFASCCLCLEPARDPVACTEGDIFCRECALSNILAQKKDMKRMEKMREQEAKEAQEEAVRKSAEARERAIKEFELTQQGLDTAKKQSSSPSTVDEKNTRLLLSPSSPSTKLASDRKISEKEQPSHQQLLLTQNGETGTNEEQTSNSNPKKRKFELDEAELQRIAEEDRARARRTLDKEMASSRAPALPSFWVPTITPSSNTKNVLHEVKKKTKQHPVCPASSEDDPHIYSLHAVVDVRFTEDEVDDTAGHAASKDKKKKRQRICPACRRALTNASRPVMAKPCGHVVCRSCVDQFMRPSGIKDPHNPDHDPCVVRCYVCDEKVTESKKSSSKKYGKDKVRPGLVDLRSEGTGFAATGSNIIKKVGVGFQC